MRSRLLSAAITALLLATAEASPLQASPDAGSEPDSLESAPAPLLVPGRPSPPDSTRLTRAEKAREQFELGVRLERSKAHAAAIAAYRNAVRFDPAFPGANYRMGMLFNTVAQYGEAARCFAAEIEHHPGDATSARELGLALARAGEARRGVAQLELLANRRPKDGATWRALGFAYSASGRPRDAERALRRALALPPADAEEHRDLGALLASQGRMSEAREQYRRATALAPRDPLVWVNLGNLERREGHREAALADYREAWRRDTTLALAAAGEAQVLRELGRDREAAEAYRRWLRASPDDLATRFEAVRLHDALGRKDVALELARDGVRRAPRTSEARLILGMALQGAGDTRAALAEIRRAESLARDETTRGRARALVASMRAAAPDSLRGLFEADSVRHQELPAAPDPARPAGTP